MNTCLGRLQSDQVDLLQYHSWSFANPYWLDTLRYLQNLKEEGLIGALGTTNFDTAHLRIAKSSGIEIVSKESGRSISAIAGKYQLGQKAVSAVIIGARLGENSYLDDAESLFTFELSERHLDRHNAIIHVNKN